VDPQPLSQEFRRRFDAKMAAREVALSSSRQAIRCCANAIRSIHRGELDEAHALMDQARSLLDAGREASLAEHPDIFFAGFLQDAEKEYAEARLTEALVTDRPFPGPDELGVGLAPYLNGMAETVGEVAECERMLAAMEDIYTLLASLDYPDAMTGGLRRSTDVARSLLERTRGDVTLSLVQRDLTEALERHTGRIGPAEG
jgi:translin